MTTMRLAELARIVNDALAAHGDVECWLEMEDRGLMDERPLKTAEAIELKHLKGEPWRLYLSERAEPDAQ